MPHGATIILAAAAAAAALALPFADSLPVFGTSIPNGMAVPCGSLPMPVRHHRTKTRQLHGVVTHTPGCSPDGFCLGLGHLDCGGGLEKDRVESTNQMALNPFGDDYRASGFSWTKELCETDSDGDGFTNGEELGDPCFQWTMTNANANATDDDSNYNGSIDEPALNAREGFVPSHPGVPGSVPPAGVDVSCQSLSSSSSSSSGGVATTRTTTTTTTAMLGSLVLTTIAVSLSLSV
mmetsp:Transcript_25756/g.70809  ORF Transcript_25756/g.70809 Transcript_25756/m.70809 type:complete len:236 (-) Transcript_25756:195-902(-)